MKRLSRAVVCARSLAFLLLNIDWRLRNWAQSAGAVRLVGGKMVATSLDVYIALEHCEAGDLHALQGQLTAAQIRSFLRQLLAGVEYLHSLQVCLVHRVTGASPPPGLIA